MPRVFYPQQPFEKEDAHHTAGTCFDKAAMLAVKAGDEAGALALAQRSCQSHQFNNDADTGARVVMKIATYVECGRVVEGGGSEVEGGGRGWNFKAGDKVVHSWHRTGAITYGHLCGAASWNLGHL